ncbi:MAG: VOC family protein [Chitinophagaceae bacterium]|nr:VOC family protein [Chitinophagaceae bacterium]
MSDNNRRSVFCIDMILNHLNLTVADLPMVKDKLTTYFDFEAMDPKPNDTLSILKSKDDFTLVLMSNRMNKNGQHAYPDAFHFGFFVQSVQEVMDKYEQLKSGNIKLDQEPQFMRKSFGFYFHLDSLMIEIAAQDVQEP